MRVRGLAHSVFLFGLFWCIPDTWRSNLSASLSPVKPSDIESISRKPSEMHLHPEAMARIARSVASTSLGVFTKLGARRA